MDEITKSTLDQTTVAAADLIDVITIRAAMLIVLFFGLLGGYRFLLRSRS